MDPAPLLFPKIPYSVIHILVIPRLFDEKRCVAMPRREEEREMTRIPFAMVGAFSLATTGAHAGFVGWTGYVHSSGGYVMLDVFAAVSNSQDHLLNVFNTQITANGTTFYQAPGLATKAWSPYFGTSSMDSADSFVTLGVFESTGTNYSATGTAGDPNFAGYSPTPVSAPSTTIPAGAGWYTTQPLSSESDAKPTPAFFTGSWQGAQAPMGIWVAHFAFEASTITAARSVSFLGTAGYRVGPSTVAEFGTNAQVFMLPAPGALALVAGAATRLRSRRTR
jgi:hypothetical protein